MFAKIVFCQQESQRERAAGLLKACQGLLELFCTGLAKYCTKAGGNTGQSDNCKLHCKVPIHTSRQGFGFSSDNA